jgi:hypothetical protein
MRTMAIYVLFNLKVISRVRVGRRKSIFTPEREWVNTMDMIFQEALTEALRYSYAAVRLSVARHFRQEEDGSRPSSSCPGELPSCTTTRL